MLRDGRGPRATDHPRDAEAVQRFHAASRRVGLPAVLRPDAAAVRPDLTGSPTSTTTTGSRSSRPWRRDHRHRPLRPDRRGEAEVAFNIADSHQGGAWGRCCSSTWPSPPGSTGSAVRRRGAAPEPPDDRGLLGGRLRGAPPLRRRRHLARVRHRAHRAVQGGAAAREHRAEAGQLHALLHPGPSSWSGRAGGRVDRATSAGQHARGRLRRARARRQPRGDGGARRAAHARVTEIPGPVDLAVVAVPAAPCSTSCGTARRPGRGAPRRVPPGSPRPARGRGAAARARPRARRHGMRVVGPNSFGVLNTSPRCAQRLARPESRHRVAGAVQPVRGARDRGAGVGGSPRLGRLRLRLRRQPRRRLRQRLHAVWMEDHRTDAVGLYLEASATPASSRGSPGDWPGQAGHRREVRITSYGVPPGHGCGPPGRPRRSTRCCARPA